MKILIEDTSPLISLIVTDNLHLLFKLYNEIYLPKAVWDELNDHIEIVVFENEMKSLKPLVKEVEVKMVLSAIDRGEIEAIT